MKSKSAGYPFISHIPAKGRHEAPHILLQEFNLRKMPPYRQQGQPSALSANLTTYPTLVIQPVRGLWSGKRWYLIVSLQLTRGERQANTDTINILHLTLDTKTNHIGEAPLKFCIISTQQSEEYCQIMVFLLD